MSDVALTLEQLREKNGQPVYWGTAKQWFIVQLAHPDFGDCVINAAGYYLPLEKAASRRFYAQQPPAHQPGGVGSVQTVWAAGRSRPMLSKRML